MTELQLFLFLNFECTPSEVMKVCGTPENHTAVISDLTAQTQLAHKKEMLQRGRAMIFLFNLFVMIYNIYGNLKI